MAFDIEGALEEGYSRTDILRHLAKTRKFDLAGALKEGYTEDDILNHFKTTSPKTTVPGYVRESLKAFPRGLVGSLESAALGAASLLPGDTGEGFEKTAREGIKGFAERLKPTVAAGYEEAIPVKVSEAIGSFGSLLIPGRLGGMRAVAPTAAAMGAGEARERAVTAGATPEQITSATQLGVIPGIAELAPVERVFRIMPKEIKGGIFDYVQRALVTGGMEGAQEAASAVAQNLIAKQVYKPSQELIEGVGENAAYGAGAGAIVQFLLDAVAGRRAAASKPTTPTAAESELEQPEQPQEQAQPVATQPIPTGAQQPLFEPLPAEGVPPVTGMAPSGKRYSADRFADEEAQGADVDLASALMERDELLRVKGIMEREFQRAPTREEAVSRRLDIEAIDAQLKAVNKRISSIEKQPTKREQQQLSKMQGQLDLQEPSESAPVEPAVTKPETTKITRDTLLGLGFNGTAVRSSNASKALQALDMSKPEDIDQFEEIIQAYKNASSAKQPVNDDAVKQFVAQAREKINAIRPEAAGEGVGVSVLGQTAGGTGAAGDGVPAVVGGEGPVASAAAGKKQKPAPLSDVEEIQTAYDIASAPKNKKEFQDAITHLSYFKNATNVKPDVKAAAAAALEELGVPEAEVQAAWENIAISEAAAQQEQSEDAAAAQSEKDQRNITDQLRRAKVAETREAKARPKKPVTAKERAQYAAAEAKMQLKAPTNVPFETAEDANALLNMYLSDIEQGDPAMRAKFSQRTKRKLPSFPAREFVDEADRAEIAKLMEAGAFDEAHTAIFTAANRAATAAKAYIHGREYLKEIETAAKFYRLSHRPIGAGLSTQAQGLLQKGDLKSALRDVMTNGSTPQVRLAARKILSAIKGTKVLVRKTPTGDAGIYSSTTDTIYIDPEGLHEHTLLHEAMHAAVAHVLANPNHPLTKKLQALLDSLPVEIKGELDLQEFAAEAMGNQEFQDRLRGQPKNWWGRLVDAVRGFLGLSKAKQIMNTLDALLEVAPSEVRRAGIGPLPLTTTGNSVLDAAIARREQAVKKATTKNKTSNWINKLRNLVVEKGAALEEKLLDKGDNAARAAKVYGLSLRSMDLAINSMIDGPIKLDSKTGDRWFTLDRGTPSFRDIYAEIDKIAAKVGGRKNAQDLFALGATYLRMQSPDISPEIRKSMNMSAADVQAAKEVLRAHGTEIKAALAKWQQYKNALLDAGLKTGRFSEADVADWKKAAEYVPWHRILDDAKNGYDTKKSTKSYFNRLVDNGKVAELIGGDINERPIGDILNNMENLSIWLVNTTVRNHTANQLVDALVNDVKDARHLTNPQQGDSARTIKTYRKGKEEYWELGDPLDKDAFDSTSTVSLPALKAMTSVANWMRKGTTLMPGFVVSQLAQDAFRVTVLSGADRPFMVGAKTFTNFAKALGPQRDKNLAYAALYEAGIAARPDFMVGDELSRLQAALGTNHTGIKKVWKSTAEFLDNMARASDAAQRMALFEETYAESGDKLDALYRASEIINFQRQGKSATVNTLRQMVPFLNAYIQGVDITYRSMTRQGISGKARTEAMRRFYATGLKIAALSWVYAMLVSDDEEYQQTADYEKLNSFILPGTREMVKDATGVDIGGNLRIPTPQDPVGFLFKSIPEQVYNYVARAGTANEVDNTKFLRIMRDGALNAISSPNMVPQAVKPSVELMVNYSFFTGRPIVGKGLEGLLKNEQFTSTTSELAKTLSPFTPLSPVQLDYFIRGTFGTAGGATTYYASQLINTASPTPLPEARLNENPMVRAFLTGKATADAKEDYYELREQVSRLASTVDRLAPVDPEKARAYLQGKPELYALAKSGLFAEVDKHLGELRVVRRSIEASELSAEDKRAKLDQLDAAELRLFNGLRVNMLRQIGGM